MTKIAPEAHHPLVMHRDFDCMQSQKRPQGLLLRSGSHSWSHSFVFQSGRHSLSRGYTPYSLSSGLVHMYRRPGLPSILRGSLDPFLTEVASNLIQSFICKGSHNPSNIRFCCKYIIYIHSPMRHFSFAVCPPRIVCIVRHSQLHSQLLKYSNI